MKARKKPIIVEVWKLDSEVPVDDCPWWVANAWKNETLDYDIFVPCWIVNTLEGHMKAYDGDYLIKGIHDELYPCRRDIFLETYEEVHDWTD